MDGVTALKSAFAGAHDWYLGTVADVGAEQANTVPPGIANPIGALITHILHCEDFMINTAVQGQPLLWERDGWAARLGGGLMVDLEQSAARAHKCDPQRWPNTQRWSSPTPTRSWAASRTVTSSVRSTSFSSVFPTT